MKKIYIFIICGVILSFFCGSCCSGKLFSGYSSLPKVNYVGMTYQEAFIRVIEEEDKYLGSFNGIKKDYYYFNYVGVDEQWGTNHLIEGRDLLEQGEEREKVLKGLFNARYWRNVNRREGITQIVNFTYGYYLRFENGVVVSQEIRECMGK